MNEFAYVSDLLPLERLIVLEKACRRSDAALFMSEDLRRFVRVTAAMPLICAGFLVFMLLHDLAWSIADAVAGFDPYKCS